MCAVWVAFCVCSHMPTVLLTSDSLLPTPKDFTPAVLDLAAEACRRGMFRELLQHDFDDIFDELRERGILTTFHDETGVDITSWSSVMCTYADHFMSTLIPALEGAGFLDALDVPDVRHADHGGRGPPSSRHRLILTGCLYCFTAEQPEDLERSTECRA